MTGALMSHPVSVLTLHGTCTWIDKPICVCMCLFNHLDIIHDWKSSLSFELTQVDGVPVGRLMACR